MKRADRSDEAVSEDLERLSDLLQESYTASYRGSSLKVRRRYRKLLFALEAESKRREHAPAHGLSAPRNTGLHR